MFTLSAYLCKVALQIIWVASLSNKIKAKKILSKSQKEVGTTCYASPIFTSILSA